jgi:predicted nucleic acid-binding protein
MRIFLDANILVSVLNKEYPVFSYSSRILSLADKRRHQLFTSPLCLAISYYFSEKKSGAKLARKKIEVLVSKITVTEMNHNMVVDSLANKKVNDFEDGLEYYAALHHKCACIITENISDFYFAEIPVYTSRAFVEKLIHES